MRRHALVRVASSLVFTVPCCVSALELEDYDDAIEALCKCDADVPQLDGKCAEVLKSRLATVSEQSRAEWLAFYAETCHGECQNAYTCFQNVGTCASRSCSEHAECCGYTADGALRCIEGQCETCAPDGATCTDDERCCSGACNDQQCSAGTFPAPRPEG